MSDPYANVDELRRKLTKDVCLSCGETTEPGYAFCSSACQSTYTAPRPTDHKYTDPTGYYL